MAEHVNSIPTIDLTNSVRQIANDLHAAMAVSGFFYLRNHAIATPDLQALIQQTQEFFAMPAAQRQAVAIDQHNRGYLASGEARMLGATRNDLKEVFFFGRELDPLDPDLLAGEPLCAQNQWPQLAGFREAVLNYLRGASQTGQQLLRGFAHMLGSSDDFFERHYQRPMARGQLIHYPAPATDAPTDQFGVAEHSDFGCITLLYQHTPGLEVRARDGRWIAVPPVADTLVVNIGDLLERWTNGRLPSTRHRVRNLTGASRYSIAIFFDPSPTAIVDPSDLPLNPSEAENATQQFEPVRAADYIIGRSRKVFAQFDASIKSGDQTPG